ncbi:MAG: phosphoribosylglycinamide synthetase C domain-containing protein [Clostridia bacterium]
MGVTATAADLPSAIEGAYAAVKSVSFKNAFYRKDIGQKALAAFKKEA